MQEIVKPLYSKKKFQREIKKVRQPTLADLSREPVRKWEQSSEDFVSDDIGFLCPTSGSDSFNNFPVCDFDKRVQNKLNHQTNQKKKNAAKYKTRWQ